MANMMKKLSVILALALMVSCASEPVAKVNTPVVEGETIALVMADASRTLSVVEALERRCSSREYAPEPLSLEELSGVVWAAAGVNRPENHHLTAPSALALYPIRLYVFLEGGVYLYDAHTHRLVRVVEGDHRAVAGTQAFVATAPLNLIYVADTSVYEGRNIPADHVRYLCGQDAAGYAQNASLYAAATGLGAVVRGSVDSDAVVSLLGLDAATRFVALGQSVGR